MILPLSFPEESLCGNNCPCLRSRMQNGVKVFKCAKYNEELTSMVLAPTTPSITELFRYLCPIFNIPLKYQVLRCEQCLHPNED